MPASRKNWSWLDSIACTITRASMARKITKGVSSVSSTSERSTSTAFSGMQRSRSSTKITRRHFFFFCLGCQPPPAMSRNRTRFDWNLRNLSRTDSGSQSGSK